VHHMFMYESERTEVPINSYLLLVQYDWPCNIKYLNILYALVYANLIALNIFFINEEDYKS